MQTYIDWYLGGIRLDDGSALPRREVAPQLSVRRCRHKLQRITLFSFNFFLSKQKEATYLQPSLHSIVGHHQGSYTRLHLLFHYDFSCFDLQKGTLIIPEQGRKRVERPTFRKSSFPELHPTPSSASPSPSMS